MKNLSLLSICFLMLICQIALGFEGVEKLDKQLLEKISKNRSAVIDIFVESISLASPMIEYGTAIGIANSGYFNNNQDNLDTGVISLSSLLTTQIVCAGLKYSFNRERPDIIYKERLFRTRFTPSFPSGHTASSFAFATSLSSAYPKLRVLLFGYAIFSGFAQVYVGNHYPLDVLAGAILGYSVSKIIVNKQHKIIDSLGLKTRQKEEHDYKITLIRARW